MQYPSDTTQSCCNAIDCIPCAVGYVPVTLSTAGSLYFLIPSPHTPILPTPFPSGDHPRVLCIYASASAWLKHPRCEAVCSKAPYSECSDPVGGASPYLCPEGDTHMAHRSTSVPKPFFQAALLTVRGGASHQPVPHAVVPGTAHVTKSWECSEIANLRKFLSHSSAEF